MTCINPLLLVCFALVGIATGHIRRPTCNSVRTPQPVRLLKSFSWSNCGSSGIPASLSSFSLGPDPLIIPGNITLALAGQTSVDARSPLPAQITLKRKVLFIWVDVPCIDNVGTCSYDDFCTVLQGFFPPAQGCPAVFTEHNIPCNCPILTGKYTLPSSVLSVPTDPLPAILTDGKYDLKLKIQTQGRQFFCLDVKFQLSSP